MDNIVKSVYKKPAYKECLVIRNWFSFPNLYQGTFITIRVLGTPFIRNIFFWSKWIPYTRIYCSFICIFIYFKHPSIIHTFFYYFNTNLWKHTQRIPRLAWCSSYQWCYSRTVLRVPRSWYTWACSTGLHSSSMVPKFKYKTYWLQ